MKNPDNTQEKLRNIFRVAPIGIGFVKNRVIQEVNMRVCEMTGYSQEELIGQSARLIYPTDEDFNYVGSEKYDQIARQGTGIVETRWQKKDGSIINVLLASTPIDTSDLSQGVAFTALDFTERKQMQDALIESEARFRALAETAPVGIVISDKMQRTVFINERFKELFGYSVEQMPSVDEWYSLAYPDKHYREKVQKDWNREIMALMKGEAAGQLMEYSVTCNDGSVKQIEFRLSTIGDLNFIFLIDHTERHEAEAAIRISERKHKEELEIQINLKTQELQKRVLELERFHQATIEREFRIKELSDEIERLKGEQP